MLPLLSKVQIIAIEFIEYFSLVPVGNFNDNSKIYIRMNKKLTLLTDAFINFILAVLLLAYSPKLINFLGVPYSDNFFYPNILGAIFLGITIALFIEAFRKHTDRFVGLGLIGAISINLCGGLVLLLWLLSGKLNLPLKGTIFLWILVVSLVVVSSIELFTDLKRK